MVSTTGKKFFVYGKAAGSCVTVRVFIGDVGHVTVTQVRVAATKIRGELARGIYPAAEKRAAREEETRRRRRRCL